ncbi:MAG TPA: V-type ATP synthase subunit D [Pelomicrobium sp.]|nr:V-type ATP synthase subunit D [Pelomicrobium sp.]
MKQQLRVAPTKSALLQLQRQSRFLEQGHDMLERKRELLTRVVQERLAQYRALRRQAAEAVTEAYRWLAIAHIRMGSHVLGQHAVVMPPALEINILPRSHVGVEYPAVEAQPRPLNAVALMWTDPSFDQARASLAEMAVLLARLGEAETALWRLLIEQRKTQKRVNALKYNIIPMYRAKIRDIRSALEEEERNALFQMKLLREAELGESGASG